MLRPITALILTASATLTFAQATENIPPAVSASLNTMTQSMKQAVDRAASTTPQPSTAALMTQCNAQWGAVQQVVPPDVYAQLRNQMQTGVAQHLASASLFNKQ